MSFIQSSLAIYLSEFKSAMAYRFSMMFSIISGPLFLIVNYIIWTGIFQASGKTELQGYTLEQMITYLTISLTTIYLTWDNIDDHYQEGVEDGGFIVELLKPVSSLRYQFIDKMGHRSLAFLIEYLPVMFIIGLIFGFEVFKTKNILWYGASVIIAFVISTLISMLVGMLAFWLVKPRGLMEIYNMLQFLINGSLLPLSLFPSALQKIFFFLPFQFISYVPARVFMGQYTLGGVTFLPQEILLYGLVQVLVLSAIVALLWKHSIKRFCGVGT